LHCGAMRQIVSLALMAIVLTPGCGSSDAIEASPSDAIASGAGPADVTAHDGMPEADASCPTSATAGTAATGPSDTFAGVAPIASEFDIDAGLQPAWGTGDIPASAVPDVVGAFRFICGAGHILYDDPIVYPCKPGKSHLHQFYGNTGANAFSTFESLRTT